MALLRKIDLALLVLLGLTGLGLGVADFIHAELLSEQQAVAIVLAELGLIAASLAAGRFIGDERNDTMQVALAELKPSEASTAKVFATGGELEAYLAQKLLTASREVMDLSWKNSISDGFAAPARQVSHLYMNQAIKTASTRIPYRELFVFGDNRRLARLDERLGWASELYSAAYYDIPRPDIPRLQFVIVDSEEAFVFSSGQGAPLFASTDPPLVASLSAYFNRCWDGSIKLKVGSMVHEQSLARVRQKYGNKARV